MTHVSLITDLSTTLRTLGVRTAIKVPVGTSD